MREHEPSSFSHEEALPKIGQRIRAQVDFADVPAGTHGRVIAADQLRYGHDVVIAWELPHEAKPLVDWFNKEEYERFLEELHDVPEAGTDAETE